MVRPCMCAHALHAHPQSVYGVCAIPKLTSTSSSSSNPKSYCCRLTLSLSTAGIQGSRRVSRCDAASSMGMTPTLASSPTLIGSLYILELALGLLTAPVPVRVVLLRVWRTWLA